MNRNRHLLVMGAVGLLLAIVAIGTEDDTPLDPDGTGPDGARALVLLLESFGRTLEVVDSTPLPMVDTAVLLDDRLSGPARADVLQWVRGGGVLVVADPASTLVPMPDQVEIGSFDPLTVEPGLCTVEALRSVGELEVDGRVGYPVASGVASCFGDRASAFVVAVPVGDGSVVAVGGAGVWTNSGLDRADNAVLAVALLAPGPDTDVAVLRSRLRVPARPSGPATESDRDDERRNDVGSGSTDLFDLMPDYMRWVVVQLALAWVVYAVARARRLGRPIVESQPVHIPGSEIVRATGRLLRSGSPSETSDILCESLRVELAGHLGLPSHASARLVADVAADRSDLDAVEIEAAIDGSAIVDEASLVALGRQHDRIREEVFGVRAR